MPATTSNDREIFERLSKIEATLARIDEIARNYAIDKARFGLP